VQFECVSDVVAACEKALKYVSDAFMQRSDRILFLVPISLLFH